MKNEIDIHFLARINRVILQYYALAEPYKTEDNFRTWLQTLIPAIRFHFEEQGFEKHKNSLPFMRFILELNDLGMDAFLKDELSNEDYSAWIKPDNILLVPKELNILNLNDKSRLA